MSAPDRSWTVGPALLWFAGCLIVGLGVLDGGVEVLADRFTAPRESQGAPVSGPGFVARPAALPESDAERTPAPPPIAGRDRAKVLALEDVCLDGAPPSCKRWGLDPLYRAIDASRQSKLGRAVRLSWYGDSVIATDAIPSRLRALFQQELGDGGPGFVYIVPPHRFCAHEGIVRTSGGAWTTHAISTTQIADGLYGVGGSTVETSDGRAMIKLNAGTVSQVELYYLAQPHGGNVALKADGKPLVEVATQGEVKQAGYAAASIAAGVAKLELAASGRVRLFGIDLENASGAVVDNLGVVSANVKSFAANNPEHFQAELAHRGADLIMVMIGANEAEWLGPSDRDTKEYAAHYEKFLAEVRRARPEAACLVVSPTDQADTADPSFPSRPVMPALIEAQRVAARNQGCGFYSTYDWMGGKGSAARWYRKGMVGTDFQHLSRKGANHLAEGLYTALMAGFQTYASH
ncbi:MAG TPA: GDSL-type esterase/lipase family protein [Kofleriaceae bacterium]|nr:GDSL-type esterase/lipase family protein [Kofleriaceae bacterium]